MENLRKIVNTCNNCWTPIYEGEAVYQVVVKSNYANNEIAPPWTDSVGTGDNRKGEITENWVQCNWCYEKWQEELARSKIPPANWWLRGTLLYFFLTGAATWAYLHFREENARKANFNFRGLLDKKIPEEVIIVPGIFLLGIPLVILIYLIFRSQPIIVNRFKIRKKL